MSYAGLTTDANIWAQACEDAGGTWDIAMSVCRGSVGISAAVCQRVGGAWDGRNCVAPGGEVAASVTVSEPSKGLSAGTLLLLGAAVVGGILLLRRKGVK